ncbi:unnamed protein product [Vitrella brassicaformis CCMP3155]|uniref:Uncharacterized protein n=1 Tax=Vitrella brassicaformis (strain CCMP3155) TaxID=1169540 RepID=A0A0G4GP36_VITBC|nr:unnamed protein product [Vitrella brassicaformis CCMP3155]|eukprot:CEM32045.1 unnamed protein product [Vitrella brassicaformis CCMP3155]
MSFIACTAPSMPAFTDAQLIGAAVSRSDRVAGARAFPRQAREDLFDANRADPRAFVECDEAAQPQGLDVVSGNNGFGQGGHGRSHCRAKAAALGAEAKQEPLPEVHVASSRPSAPAQASYSALRR